MKCGGGSRTRTGDIRLAKPTLYQLSYAPNGAGGGVRQRFGLAGGFQFFVLGGAAGKPSAPCVAGSGTRPFPAGRRTDELTIGTPDCSGSVSLERR